MGKPFFELLESELELLQESDLSRIRNLMKDGPWAILTSWRGDLSQEENEKNFKVLKGFLKSKNFVVVEMEGVGQEEEGPASEPSLFIANIPEGAALTLGKKYNQFAIIAGEAGSDIATLIEKSGKKTRLGKFTPNQVGEFFSRVKGKTFVFK